MQIFDECKFQLLSIGWAIGDIQQPTNLLFFYLLTVLFRKVERGGLGEGGACVTFFSLIVIHVGIFQSPSDIYTSCGADVGTKDY